MDKTIDMYTPGDVNFVHFSTTEERKQFTLFLFLKKIKFSHVCCNGLGVGFHLDTIEIHKIVRKFDKAVANSSSSSNTSVPIEVAECGVCFENKTMVYACNTCKHPFCIDCVRRFPGRKCAYCRSTMLNV